METASTGTLLAATATTTLRSSSDALWTCTQRDRAWRRSQGRREPVSQRFIPGSKKALWAKREMSARRQERAPSVPDIPLSVRRIRGLNSPKREVRTISFDEMWTYVGVRRGPRRRSVWIWTAVMEERDGSRWMDFEVGERGRDTFMRLCRRLPDADRYRSDEYEVYNWLPPDRHVSGKGSEVNRNEGLHSVLRGKLNRLARRTKGYSKSVDALVGSLAMVWIREGWI